MENKLRKFKVIDEEGFISKIFGNDVLIREYLKEGCFIGYIDQENDLVHPEMPNLTLIDSGGREFKYFKEIPLEQEQEYWKENTPLEKSLLVGKKCQGEKAFQIEHVGEEIVLLREVASGKESCTTKDNLKSLLPDEEEILFQKVLSKWKGLTLDNAYDHRRSVVNLGKFYDVVKEVFDEYYKS